MTTTKQFYDTKRHLLIIPSRLRVRAVRLFDPLIDHVLSVSFDSSKRAAQWCRQIGWTCAADTHRIFKG